MVLFFNSSYTEVWNKLVAGLDWANRFRARVLLGMQPSAAAITYARQRLGWQVMERLLAETAGPLAGQEQLAAVVSGRRLVGGRPVWPDPPHTPRHRPAFRRPA